MLDIAMAPLLCEAVQIERERQAHDRRWLRRLRDLKRADEEARVRQRTVVIGRPSHLAGLHRL